MTARRSKLGRYLSCDNKLCNKPARIFPIPGDGTAEVPEARAAAFEKGWRTAIGSKGVILDVCPSCVEQMAELADRLKELENETDAS